jgi:hypothetical protein
MRTNKQLFSALDTNGDSRIDILRALIKHGELDILEGTANDPSKLRRFINECKTELAKLLS